MLLLLYCLFMLQQLALRLVLGYGGNYSVWCRLWAYMGDMGVCRGFVLGGVYFSYYLYRIEIFCWRFS